MAAVTWIITVLVLFAGLPRIAGDHAPAFKDGKRLVYQYSGRYATGLVDGRVHQFSGAGVKARLSIEKNGQHVRFQISDLVFAPFNKQLDDLLEVIPLTYKPAEEFSSPEKLANISCLPFTALYVQGVIRETTFEDNDNEYSINMKHALISLFQTNFATPRHEDPDHYHVMEESPVGDCDTVYQFTYLPPENQRDNIVMNVTKHPNYYKCLHRPHLFHSNMQGSKCTQCRHESSRPMESLSRINYHINGNRQEFLIETIESTGTISFTPFTTNGQTILSIVNQSLTLLKIEDTHLERAPYVRPTGKNAKVYNSLVYQFKVDRNSDHQKQDSDNAHYFSSLIHKDYGDIEKQSKRIPSLLLAKSTVPVIKILQQMTYEELAAFYKQHVWDVDSKTPNESEKYVRTWLINLLGKIGTNPAIVYAVDSVKAGKPASNHEALSLVNGIGLNVQQPTAALYQRILNFAKSEDAKKNPTLFNHLWLNYAIFLHKGCVSNMFNPHTPNNADNSPKYISTKNCDKFVEDIILYFNGYPVDSSPLLLMRVLKNIRTERAFTYLLNVAQNTNAEDFIRHVAISGLMGFAEQNNHKIIAATSSIFHNVSEDYVTRIYAFETLLYTDEGIEFYADLAAVMVREKNPQLTKYIYSLLVNIANSTDPCLAIRSQHARRVLKYIKPVRASVFRRSSAKLFSTYNDKYNFGHSSEFAWISSNSSIIPREVYMRQSINMLGYNFDVIELGFRQQGMEHYQYDLPYLMGHGGQYQEHYMHGNFKKLFDLGVLQGNEKAGEPGPNNMEFYSSTYGHDLHSSGDVLSDLPMDLISGILEKADLLEYPVNFHELATYSHVMYAIPNDMGILVTMDLFVPAVLNVNGTVKYHSHNDDSYQGTCEASLDARANIFLLGEIGVVSNIGTGSFALQMETDIHYKFDGTFKLNLKQKKIHLEYLAPNEPYEVIRYKTFPMTNFGDHTIMSTKTIRQPNTPTKKNYNLGHDYFGTGIGLRVEHDNPIDIWQDGANGFLDYIILNPNLKYIGFTAKLEPGPIRPTRTFLVTVEFGNEVNTIDKVQDEKEYAFQNLDVAVTGTANATERKWKMKLVIGTKKSDRISKKILIQLEQLADSALNRSNFKACFRSFTSYKGYPDILRNDKHYRYDTNFSFNAKLQIGPNCEEERNSKSQLTIKAFAEKSDEQLALGKRKLPFYQKCDKDRKRNNPNSFSCWLSKRDLGRLDKFTIAIHHDNLPLSVKRLGYKLQSSFRNYFYDNLEVEEARPNKPANEIKVAANFSYWQPVVDVHLENQQEISSYRNIYVPAIWPVFEHYSLVNNFLENSFAKILNSRSPMCFISGNNIWTFDRVFYNITTSDCLQLVYADCFLWRFAVFMRSIHDHQKYTRSLKVYFEEDEIEITPTAGTDDKDLSSGLAVSVNGVQILKDDYEHSQYNPRAETTTFIIYPFLEGYTIEAPFYGVKYLYFDGTNLEAQGTNLQIARVCGMCGNFNADKSDEFTDHRKCQIKDPDVFSYTYTIPEENCTYPDIKYPCAD